MTTSLAEIKLEIEQATERRSQILRLLSERHDAALAAERRALEQRLEQLWDLQRELRAMLIHGDRDRIIARARQEERLSRAA